MVRGGDQGFTLVELMVSMFIFSLLLVVFSAGITSISRSTARVTATGDAMTELNRLYNRLDKEVPYASAINRSVLSNGSWYLEHYTKTTDGSVPFCTQYRLVNATGQIQVRRWNATGAAGLTTWNTLATGVEARGGAPFTMLPADQTYVRQRLVVAVDVRKKGTPVQQLDTTLVARNTTPDTGTNADQNNDGISDSQVCQGAGRP